jgi:hypothetical protein
VSLVAARETLQKAKTQGKVKRQSHLTAIFVKRAQSLSVHRRWATMN